MTKEKFEEADILLRDIREINYMINFIEGKTNVSTNKDIDITEPEFIQLRYKYGYGEQISGKYCSVYFEPVSVLKKTLKKLEDKFNYL